MKNLKQYHDAYLEQQVNVLHHQFEKFRNKAIKMFNIDPVHLYSISSFSFECCLKYTGCSPEFIKDEAMYNMIQKNIRGGLSYVCKRKARANLPGVIGYDSEKPITSLLYLDINNLYGYVMEQ